MTKKVRLRKRLHQPERDSLGVTQIITSVDETTKWTEVAGLGRDGDQEGHGLRKTTTNEDP